MLATEMSPQSRITALNYALGDKTLARFETADTHISVEISKGDRVHLPGYFIGLSSKFPEGKIQNIEIDTKGNIVKAYSADRVNDQYGVNQKSFQPSPRDVDNVISMIRTAREIEP